MVLLVGLVGLRLSVIDLAEHRLPDRLTFPLFGSLVTMTLAGGSAESARGALVGSLATGAMLWVLAVIPGKPLGMGDVKFQFSLGWLLGFVDPALALMGVALTFVTGGLSVLPALFRRRAGLSDPIALGPWMMVATCCVALGIGSPKII